MLVEPLQDWAKLSPYAAIAADLIAPPLENQAYGFGLRSGLCMVLSLSILTFSAMVGTQVIGVFRFFKFAVSWAAVSAQFLDGR